MTQSVSQAEDPKAFRLPRTVRPTAYEISVNVDLDRSDFDGRVAIQLDVREPAQRIVLHARRLRVVKASLVQQGREVPARVEAQPERETITVVPAQAVSAGAAELRLEWTGPVGSSMEGLYLSQDGAERCLATQCEATDARNILPCFDEPEFKASFAWRVTAPKGLTVLANGPQRSRTDNGDGTATWSFEPTQPISSYLLAFSVGEFASTSETVARHVPFRVWALAGKENLGGHARDFAAKLLPWYEDYFGVAYPFGKYDQLAVPSFSFGAMENVGLVLFRSSLLLTDPKTTSWQGRKSIDLVVAHEFAHMWFGNLVTMRWWDDLWLNESFAEWIAHKAVDALQPADEVWHDFQGRTAGALATDALASTHSVYNAVKTPAEASEMFDAITYGKGSAVLRMLEGFLGEDAFRRGLQSYMKAFAHGNAAGADLWNHLGKASSQPVGQIMGSWVDQPGHPIVSVSVSRSEGKSQITLRQRRAVSSPKTTPGTQVWKVPLVLRFRDDSGTHTRRVLLEQAESTQELPVLGRLHWLHANASDLGFYRTDPSDELLAGLRTFWAELTPPEQVGLLRDQWNLVRSGRKPVTAYLDVLAAAARGDDHVTVVEHVVGSLRDMDRILEMANEEKAVSAFRKWVAERFFKDFERVGLEPAETETPQQRSLRSHIVRAVAAVGRHPDAASHVVQLAEKERAEPASVDPNLAGLAVGVAAQQGDAARFDLHVATYRARREAKRPPQEVDRYLYSLAAFQTEALVRRLLSGLAELAPKQAIGPILRLLLGEPHAQRAAWEHVKQVWPQIRENLGDAWTANIVEAAGHLPPDLQDDAVQFLEPRTRDVGRQAFGRAKERLAERGELFARIVPDLASWAMRHGA